LEEDEEGEGGLDEEKVAAAPLCAIPSFAAVWRQDFSFANFSFHIDFCKIVKKL
jgi:hypothetical protein